MCMTTHDGFISSSSFSTVDEYSPQRKVGEQNVVCSLYKDRNHFIEQSRLWNTKLGVQAIVLTVPVKDIVLLFDWNPRISLLFRARHFSTNWAWKRTGSSPDVHRGRPRKVSCQWGVLHTFLPSYVVSKSTEGRHVVWTVEQWESFQRMNCEGLEMQIPESWLMNSF